MHDLTFEWNDEKERINIRQHGIDFDTASSVFFDYHTRIMPDTTTPVQEQRYIAIGIANTHHMLLVVHCYRDEQQQEIIRIISARKLSKGEIKKYGYR